MSSLPHQTSGTLRWSCFCAASIAKKDGEDHPFSIVENHRIVSDKTVRRTVLYLGEINDQQQAAWRRTLSVFDEQPQEYANLSLLPNDREIPADAIDTLRVKLSGRTAVPSAVR